MSGRELPLTGLSTSPSYSINATLMVASQLACVAFFVCLKWPLCSSDFLSRNCLKVGNCFAPGAAGSEGEARLRLVWLVSETLPTMLSLEDKDVSASTFAPQFGQNANDDSKPLPQFRQNMLDLSKMASICDETDRKRKRGKQRDQASMTV